jgi:gas vesicle protein GvpL/GvpF
VEKTNMSDTAQAVLKKAQQPPGAAAEGRQYLFAILYAADVRAWGCAGLDGKEVSTIVEGRLAAVVGGVSSPRVRPERRNLAAHQEVLQKLLATTTPLPMAFGILADTPRQIRDILQRNQRTFLDQLQRVAGKVEMGLRVSWDVPNIFEYFVNTHPELRTARDCFLGGGRLPTQEEKIELGRTFDRLLGEDRDNYMEQVERILARAACEIKVGKCRAEQEVMNLACLVERPAQENFGSAVFQAAQGFDNNFAFDYNGPWAPYNFVDVTLEA